MATFSSNVLSLTHPQQGGGGGNPTIVLTGNADEDSFNVTHNITNWPFTTGSAMLKVFSDAACTAQVGGETIFSGQGTTVFFYSGGKMSPTSPGDTRYFRLDITD